MTRIIALFGIIAIATITSNAIIAARRRRFLERFSGRRVQHWWE